MDKTLKLKIGQFKKSLDRLNEVLSEKDKSDILRDSTIKRFEFCFELCWKVSKVYLRDVLGQDFFSPKEVFRGLLKNQLLNEKDVELLLQMTDDRNLTTHTYNEKFIKALYRKLPKYYKTMLKVLNVLEKQNIKNKKSKK